MSLMKTAKQQIEFFGRPSVKVTKALIEHVEQLEKEKQEQQERIKKLEKDNHRKEVFIRGHVEKWDGVRHINPSIQVLKRALK